MKYIITCDLQKKDRLIFQKPRIEFLDDCYGYVVKDVCKPLLVNVISLIIWLGVVLINFRIDNAVLKPSKNGLN